MKRVEIKIEDNKRYGDVAFLVDRQDFLKDIKELRKKWKLGEKLFPYKVSKKQSWLTFPWRSMKIQDAKKMKKVEEKIHNLNLISKMSNESKNKLFQDYKKALRKEPSTDFWFDITDLRNKYKKPANFDKIIIHAVIYGEVRDKDYVTCSVECIQPDVDSLPYFEQAKAAIIVYPYAKVEEIETVRKAKLRKIMKKCYGDCFKMNPDTISNIKRDREWYWKKLQKEKGGQGKSYRRIAIEEKTNINVHSEAENIRKAFKQYEKRLHMPLAET